MIKKILFYILDNFFVPMDKWDRLKYERFYTRYSFPFKKAIGEVWHKEIKAKYPDIWKYPGYDYESLMYK